MACMGPSGPDYLVDFKGKNIMNRKKRRRSGMKDNLFKEGNKERVEGGKREERRKGLKS
jgi:hypothetical protein